MKPVWRVDDSWIALERPLAVERELDRSFEDEVAIDFPALTDKVARMRRAFVDSDDAVDWLSAEIDLEPHQAATGGSVPVDLPVRSTCRSCCGRGEVWNEPCECCGASGYAFGRRTVSVSVPPGVRDGSRFRFSVANAQGLPTRVEVRVAVSARGRQGS